MLHRYGIESKDLAADKETNVLFVDVGASHMTNTIVSYFINNISTHTQVVGAAARQTHEPGLQMPSMQVKAVTYDAAVGGSSFDRKLTLYLAEEFNKLHQKKIQVACLQKWLHVMWKMGSGCVVPPGFP